jgi:hypothetical protein
VDVLVGGADSSSNAIDKFFPEGYERSPFWPDAFDFCSIHYQGLNAPVLYRRWNERTAHHGRVLVWDTESWVANTDDKVAGLFAANRAAGYDRSLGIYGRNVANGTEHGGERSMITVRTRAGEQRIPMPVMTWSPAASIAAADSNGRACGAIRAAAARASVEPSATARSCTPSIRASVGRCTARAMAPQPAMPTRRSAVGSAGGEGVIPRKLTRPI